MKPAKTPVLSIVVPVYNEELSVPRLVSELSRFQASHPDLRPEIILVDDHSSDATSDLLSSVCRTQAGFRYLRLTKNSGSHIAILAGLAHSRGECAVFMAADLQDPPELLPDLIDRWRSGFRVVWAVRQRREKTSFIERMFAKVFYWLLNHMSDVQIPPTGVDFALLDRRVVKALLASLGANPSIIADVASLGFRATELQYVKQARRVGQSKWTMRMRLRAFADAFVGHTFVPIRLMSYLGFGCASLGFLGALLAIALRLIGSTQQQGWAGLMVTVLIVSGIQMMMLGVLGEYLWRTLGEVRKRHLYIIEDDVNCLDAAEARLKVGRLVEHEFSIVARSSDVEKSESDKVRDDAI